MVVVDLRSRPRERRGYPGGRSARAWWLTIGSGAALLLLVPAHIVAQHFVVDEVGGMRTYHQVLAYIGNPLILALECLLLVSVTIHAMLGVRSVLLDLDLSRGARRRISIGLWAFGVTTIAYGLVLLALLASRS